MSYRVIINPEYKHLETFVQQLPVAFDNTGTLIYDARNKVRTYEVDGETIVVKRFKRPALHQRIDYTFIRPSKAKRAFDYAMRLLQLDIDTPKPIACIEEYRFGLFRQGYFLSTYCGDPDCRILREELEGHEDLIHSLATFVADCHTKGFLHGDTNLSNFLYRKAEGAPGGYHITTIDINRSHFVKDASKEKCLKSLFRMTHVRPALQMIVGEYAAIRGWDSDECIGVVLDALTRFEKSKEMRKNLKRKLGISK